MLARERPADRKRGGVPDAVEIDNGPVQDWKLTRSRNHGGFQGLHTRQAQIAHQSLHRAPAVRARAVDASEESARPHHRFQQSSRSNSVAEFETVGDQPFHSQMLRQGAHDVLQALAHQHDFVAGFDAGFK